METRVAFRHIAPEVSRFIEMAISDPRLLAELKGAPDDASFVDLAVAQAVEAGIPLTAETLEIQIVEDRRIAREVSLDEVEAAADRLVGARLSGGHQSHMPPNC